MSRMTSPSALTDLHTSRYIAQAPSAPVAGMLLHQYSDYKQPAAQLLNHIDQQARRSAAQEEAAGGSAVWTAVQQALQSCHGEPCVAIELQVDVAEAADEDPLMANILLADTDLLCHAAAELIQQQLCSTQQHQQSHLPLIILRLNLTSAPLPLLQPSAVRGVLQKTPACKAPVSVIGVIAAASSTFQCIHSRTFACSSCGSTVQVLEEGLSCLPCCSRPVAAAGSDEVLAGRVLLPAQKVTLSDLSHCPTSSSSYGISSSHDVEVVITGPAAGQVQLGDVLHVIGQGRLVRRSHGLPYASLSIKALQVQQVSAHVMWPKAPGRLPQQLQDTPLESSCRLLTAALQQQLDAPLALSLLLSAAVAGTAAGSGVTTAGAGDARQINLLVVHEPFCPLAKRTLQAAAACLSPIVVHLPAAMADQVVPPTKAASLELQTCVADAAEMTHSSLLTTANQGVAVVDWSALSSKTCSQLSKVLPQRQLNSNSSTSSSNNTLNSTTSATIWAAANAGDVQVDAGGSAKRSSKSAVNAEAFDLLLRCSPDPEDEVNLVFGRCTAVQPAAADLAQRSSQLLHSIISRAAQLPAPVLSEPAHKFLLQYVLLQRQGLVPVPHTALLKVLVKVAGASAQLCGRQQILEQPDAVLAVLLVDATLALQLGPGYQSALDLPCGLTPTGQHTMDSHLGLLHGMLCRLFKQYVPDSQDLSQDLEWEE